MSKSQVSLSTSTLYTALKRLLELEWIHREDSPGTGLNGRERKVYHLTDLGRQVLEAEIARLESMLHAAQQRAVEESS